MLAKHSILERVLRPDQGDVPPDFARKLLALHFESADHARYEELSGKAQAGELTPQEKLELDDMLIANDVLAILHAKAITSLRRGSSAA